MKEKNKDKYIIKTYTNIDNKSINEIKKLFNKKLLKIIISEELNNNNF